MALHLLKLGVGTESIQDLVDWIEENRILAARLGRPHEQAHTTRMFPKRASEIAGQGSLYWVVKGWIACRQRILELRPVTGEDGIGRCRIVLEPVVRAVAPRPCRPFQGWRYFPHRDVPPDLDAGSGSTLAQMPEAMRRELAGLGLL